MEIDFSSDTRIDIKLPNGKSIILLYAEKQDEITLCFGKGHRYLKEMQNRSDGYSGASFTKAE